MRLRFPPFPFPLALALIAATALLLPACAVAPEDTAAEAQLHDQVQLTLRSFMREDPSLERELENSYGYAVFPSIGKGGALLAGGSWGRGEVYEQGDLIGYATASQATLGPQIGGQSIRELILFQNKDAFDRFISEQLTFTGDINAVALQPGIARSTNFTNGVKVFTQTEGGLMAELSVGGQNFEFNRLREGAPTPTAVYGTTPEDEAFGTTPSALEQQQQELRQQEQQQRLRELQQERRDIERQQRQVEQRMQNLQQREQQLQQEAQQQEQQIQQQRQQQQQPGEQQQPGQQQQPGAVAAPQQDQQAGQQQADQELQQLMQEQQQLQQRLQELERQQQQLQQQIQEAEQARQREQQIQEEGQQQFEPQDQQQQEEEGFME
ncbi:MAG: hypothetical protein ACODAQ_04910 [Phycisphaeraceae bacterium]